MIIFPLVAQIETPANSPGEITPNNFELTYNVDITPDFVESQD